MELSCAGLNLLKEFEGLALESYLCQAGIPTIGYGHTQGVKLGMSCTEEQAEEWLKEDVAASVRAVNDMCRAAEVETTQGQFDALVSFVFNLGASALAKSTLWRLFQEGDIAGAAGEFQRWNKAGNKVSNGLSRRRAAERDLFLQ